MSEINKKKLKKSDFNDIKKLMTDINNEKLGIVLNIILENLNQNKNNFEVFQYYLSIFIKYFENGDYKSLNHFFNQMNFFTKEYNMVILMITMIWKINNYFSNLETEEQEIIEKL